MLQTPSKIYKYNKWKKNLQYILHRNGYYYIHLKFLLENSVIKCTCPNRKTAKEITGKFPKEEIQKSKGKTILLGIKKIETKCGQHSPL